MKSSIGIGGHGSISSRSGGSNIGGIHYSGGVHWSIGGIHWSGGVHWSIGGIHWSGGVHYSGVHQLVVPIGVHIHVHISWSWGLLGPLVELNWAVAVNSIIVVLALIKSPALTPIITVLIPTAVVPMFRALSWGVSLDLDDLSWAVTPATISIQHRIIHVVAQTEWLAVSVNVTVLVGVTVIPMVGTEWLSGTFLSSLDELHLLLFRGFSSSTLTTFGFVWMGTFTWTSLTFWSTWVFGLHESLSSSTLSTLGFVWMGTFTWTSLTFWSWGFGLHESLSTLTLTFWWSTWTWSSTFTI